MKDSCLAKLVSFLVAILSFSVSSAGAGLEQGKVYRFVNVAYPALSLCVSSQTTVRACATVENSKTQLWYVDTKQDAGGNPTYRLRSLRTGKYMQGGGNVQWKLVDDGSADNTWLYLHESESGCTLGTNTSTGGVNKMHCDASHNIVGWNLDATATWWTVTEVEELSGETIDAAWLEANWAEAGGFPPSDDTRAAYQTALDAIFSDKACTTLGGTYSSMSETALEADANYQALPAALRAMVKKIWSAARGTSVDVAWKEDHCSGDEALAWDGGYARRFRVQMYEPYTERNCTNAALGINPHTNLNNPTGIFANEGDLLYVMVDNEVPAGASLYLGSCEGHSQAGEYNDGVELHRGLNIIPFYKEKMWTCIYYTVPTLKKWDGTTNKTEYDLTQFPDLKIHIEGGFVNGFFNAVGDDLWAHDAATTGCDAGNNVASLATTLTKADGSRTAANANLLQANNVYPKGDNEADWDYYAARNVLPDITILGRYMVFQFYYESPESNHPEYSTSHWFNRNADGTRRMRVSDWLERWDRVMMSERLTMGLLGKEEMAEANARFHAWDDEKHDIYTYTGTDGDFGCDYSRHYRMHGLAISNNDGYMSGGWTSSNYHYNTLGSIIGEMTDPNSAGGVVWGPGHEIGHQHQGPLNMRGLTEVTNNLFANVAVWYDGRGTSRVNGGEGDLTEVLKAYNQTPHDFFTNNIWAQTHMYYKLWLYYHLAGKNTKFYPTLMEMLRRDPMNIVYDQSGNTSLLHFYKKVCEAAGEDLTEFFRAYGFFEVMDNRYVGDYSSAEYTQTQEDIDAAIAGVKAKNYPANTNVLFINDYTTGSTYKSHDGTTDRKLWDGATYSDLGSVTVFDGTETSDISGNYNLTVTDGQATVSGGSGGLGFLVYDEDGKLLSFSSDYSFPVNDATTLAIAKGTATILSVPLEGEPQEVTYDTSSAAVSLLKSMLETANTELGKNSDDGGESGDAYTHAGYYRSNGDTYAALAETYQAAKDVYAGGDVTAYPEAYRLLHAAYEALLADADATVPVVCGNKYYIRSKGKSGRYMYVNATTDNDATTYNIMTSASLPDDKAAYMWSLEQVAKDGKYYLRNHAADGLYVLNVTAENGVWFACGSEKYAFDLTANGVGTFNIYSAGAERYVNADGASDKVVSWGARDDANSLWEIELAEEDALTAGLHRLQTVAAQTRELMDRMADVKVKGRQDLSLLRITSNATEQGHGTELLTDGDTETFFHTNWTGEAPVSEPHYIQIDFADAQAALDNFQLQWQTLPTSAWNVDAPMTVVVQIADVSADDVPAAFTDIATLSSEDAVNPLPTAKGQAYTSAEISTGGTPYRFMRLQVTRATGGNWGSYPYFGLAELGMTIPGSKVCSIGSEYAGALSGETLKQIADAIGDALGNTYTDAAEVATLTEQMKEHYQTLSQVYDAVADAGLEAARRELRELADKTQALIGECGTVEKVDAEAIPLQSTDASAPGYLWCNAPYTAQNNGDYSEQGTDGYHLLDGDIDTYLHTDYSGATSGEHYLRVDMGDQGIGQFSFTYSNRNANVNPGNPATIVVEGSDSKEGGYTEIATVSKGDALNPLPINSASSYGASWKSFLLGNQSTRYRYIRFRVTRTNGGGNNWFYMSEFGMESAPYYTATVGTASAGVTEELLLATENARVAALTAINLATDAEQLTAAKDELARAYEALHEAMYSGHALQLAIDAFGEAISKAEDVRAATPGSVNLTAALIDEMKAVKAEAQDVCDRDELTEEDIIAATASLTGAKERLQQAVDYAAVPVMLTADASSPVYYTVIINRSGYPVFQSRTADEGSENKIRLTAYDEAGNDRQMWYFVKGSEAPKVRIVCRATPDLIVGCTPSDFAEGAGKIISLAPDADCGTNEWEIVSSAGDWYNITADNNGTTFYMSNYGDVDYNMGFYNDNHDTDGGSNFKFRVAGNEAYKRLYDYFNNETKVDLSATDGTFPAELTDDEAVGYYPTQPADNYAQAYRQAASQLLVHNAAGDAYTRAYEALKAANEALGTNAPEAGAFYFLRNASATADDCTGALAYAETESACRVRYDKNLTSADARTLWQFTDNGDGTFLMKNLHTGMYATSGTPFHTAPAGRNVTFSPLGDGQLVIKVDGNSMCALSGSGEICADNGSDAKDTPAAWLVEKADDMESVFQSVTLTGYQYAGFYSAYPVTLPEGLRAFYVREGEATEQAGETVGHARLTEITGVIPAHTGVVLYGNAGPYEMHYTSEAAGEVGDNMLRGSSVVSYKQGAADTNYYLFGVKSGVVGLYQAWLQYDGEGNIAEGSANTDNGGYFKVSANKIYMPFAAGGNGVSGFRFDFVQTGIEGVRDGIPAGAAVYDMHGRRINQVRRPGLYIINGEKRMAGKPSIK